MKGQGKRQGKRQVKGQGREQGFAGAMRLMTSNVIKRA